MKILKIAIALLIIMVCFTWNVHAATFWKSVEIPLKSIVTTYSEVTRSTDPSFKYSTSPALVFSPRPETGGTIALLSPALVTIEVPPNYNKDGEWRLVLTRDNKNVAVTDKTVAIDYEYWINREGELWNETAADRAPVFLALTSQAYPDEIVLSSPTVLKPKDWLTLKFWRHPGGTDENDLRLLNVMFYFKPKY